MNANSMQLPPSMPYFILHFRLFASDFHLLVWHWQG